jgi:hypothetical protein
MFERSAFFVLSMASYTAARTDFSRSTKPAPHFGSLAKGTGKHRPFPALSGVFPHPLQNRVPRGECVPVARKLRADRSGSADRVLLPLPKNRRKHCVSAGFLFLCVVLTLVQTSFYCTRLHPVAPALACSHPLQHPKRTRFCLFRLNPGAFSRFSHFWTRKIFGTFFVHSAA